MTMTYAGPGVVYTAQRCNRNIKHSAAKRRILIDDWYTSALEASHRLDTAQGSALKVWQNVYDRSTLMLWNLGAYTSIDKLNKLEERRGVYYYKRS